MKQIVVASAFIYREGMLLIVKRAATKSFLPGVYEIPGGKVEFGEHVRAALAREVREELDLEIEIGQPFDIFEYMIDSQRQGIEIDFLVTMQNPHQAIVVNPQDHSEYQWITEDEIDTYFDHNDSVRATLNASPTHPTLSDEDPVRQVIHNGFAALARQEKYHA
jgi:8-oxo-dGTP diphosphatase